MAANVLITFDGHTPYLAFRVRCLQEEIERRGLADQIRMRVLLLSHSDSNYNWDISNLSAEYGGVPIEVLMKEFHGLGFRKYATWLAVRTACKTLFNVLAERPKIAFVGGYDRPSCLVIALLGRLFFFKTGVMHDSRFNDAESFSKSLTMELAKAIPVRLYHFFMCSGQECVDYTRFLAGTKRPALIKGWNVLDNDDLARRGDQSEHDAEIRATLGIGASERFFFLPSRFIAKKNIPHVVAAYGAARGSLSDFPRLIIAGRGPMKEEVVAQIEAAQLGEHVTLIDWLPYEQIPRVAKLSEAVLLASTDDQWGLIINEALAAGAPVLVSNRAGAHELVENHSNGFTFDPKNSEHLTTLLHRLGTDQALVEELRQKTRASMANFSKTQFLAAWFEIFERYGLET